MRAVQIQNDEGHSIVYRQNVSPPEPGEKELLIRVLASPINPSDVINATGGFPHTEFPRIPGRDFAGVILKAPTTASFQEGDEVYGTSGPELSFTKDGAHAEWVVVSEDAVAKKPESLTFAQAAACGTPLTTARLVLTRTQAKDGDTVLVLGAAGAVGSNICQIAKALGCTVIDAARRDASKVNLLKDPNLETVRDLTSGKGVDICVDTTGNADLIKSSLQVLADFGRLACIRVQGEPEVKIDLRKLYRSNHSLFGFNSVTISAAEMAASLTEMTGWIDSGKLTAPSEASFTKVSIEGLKAAYESLISGEAKGKKYMVEFPLS